MYSNIFSAKCGAWCQCAHHLLCDNYTLIVAQMLPQVSVLTGTYIEHALARITALCCVAEFVGNIEASKQVNPQFQAGSFFSLHLQV